METLNFIDQNNRSREKTVVHINTYRLKKDARLSKWAMVPLLSLVYILNGSHDPKKVQRLNLTLSAIFFAVGFFFNQDLLQVGFIFLGVALVNGVNVWIVKNLKGNAWDPLEGNILSYVHLPLQNHHRG